MKQFSNIVVISVKSSICVHVEEITLISNYNQSTVNASVHIKNDESFLGCMSLMFSQR